MSSYSRTRSKDSRVNGVVISTSQTGTVTTETKVKYLGEYKEMQDNVTKDFYKKSSQGLILMNPMRSFGDSFAYTQISNYAVWTASDPRVARKTGPDGYWIGWAQRPVSYSGNAIISAARQAQLGVETATRVLSQARRTSTDNWENLAEVGKTLEMLKSPVSSWLTWNRKFQLISAGLSTANAWLAYRYGVRPLISSVDGMIKEMRRNVKPTRQTTRAKVNDQGSVTITGGVDVDGHHTRWAGLKTETYEVRCMSIDEVAIDTWDQGGLSAKSLLTLPWELVPYSFVVDWLANVGDYIGALAQGFFPSSLGQCQTEKWLYSESRSTTSTWMDYPKYGTPGTATAVFDAFIKQRYTALSRPGIVVRSDFRFDSATRLADSIALIGQQILQRFR